MSFNSSEVKKSLFGIFKNNDDPYSFMGVGNKLYTVDDFKVASKVYDIFDKTFIPSNDLYTYYVLARVYEVIPGSLSSSDMNLLKTTFMEIKKSLSYVKTDVLYQVKSLDPKSDIDIYVYTIVLYVRKLSNYGLVDIVVPDKYKFDSQKKLGKKGSNQYVMSMLKELDHVAQLCLSSLWLLKKSVRHARKK
jgi:hypothetical protein